MHRRFASRQSVSMISRAVAVRLGFCAAFEPSFALVTLTIDGGELVGVFILAFLILAVVLLLLALFGRHPTVVRGELAARERMLRGELGPTERIDPRSLHDLVVELLRRVGLPLIEDTEDPNGERQRLVAKQPGPFGDRRHVVILEAAPPGDIVANTTPLELAE